MAQLLSSNNESKKYKKHSLKVDMTPMVDLGFLLITFFIFTTSMAESKGLKLYMPVDDYVHSTKQRHIKSVNGVTCRWRQYLLLSWSMAGSSCMRIKYLVTNYNLQTGLGKIIRTKQKVLGVEKSRTDVT